MRYLWILVFLVGCADIKAQFYTQPDDPVREAMDFAVEQTGYDPAPLPRIFVSRNPGQLAEFSGWERLKRNPNSVPVAFYYAQSRTIVMPPKGYSLAPIDRQAALVHEMVHYLQHYHNRPVCMEVWEEEAYRAQKAFYEQETGVDQTEWFYAVMSLYWNTGCGNEQHAGETGHHDIVEKATGGSGGSRTEAR